LTESIPRILSIAYFITACTLPFLFGILFHFISAM